MRHLARAAGLGVFLLCWALTAVADGPSALADSGSPYLRLHASDPVKWQRWSPEALAQARASDRLVFLSIGYYACHWCHVMQRESFQDRAVAAYLNRHFISVKVDREVESVLDAQMMQFMEATRGQGGWPLSVFLTPEGYPLVGTVYLPRDDFLAFLQRLQARWGQQAPELTTTAREGWQELNGQAAARAALENRLPAAVLRERFVDAAMSRADELAGGFGYQSKFPSVPQLRGLLTAMHREPDPRVAAFVRMTLDAMRDGGLRDHVGEGFFRYTVDPQWQIPHFEKMLYDNAQLAQLYLEAAVILDDPVYRTTGIDTLHFVLDVMQSRHGKGYIASLSAVDDRDIEGGYYLWEPEVVEAVAGEQWTLVQAAWGMDQPRSLDAGYLPHLQNDLNTLAATLGLSAAELAAVLNRVERGLLERRAQRGLPRDDKRLAGWNGLLLSALALAADAGDARSAAAAKEMVTWFDEALWHEKTLWRGQDREGRSLGPGVLADYAYVAAGVVAHARSAGDDGAWRLARELVDSAWDRFYDAGRWTLDSTSLLPGDMALAMIPDDVQPSASATMLLASTAVARHFDDAALMARVKEASALQTNALTQAPFDHPSYITRVAPQGSAQER